MNDSEVKTYKQRFIILVIVTILSISNSTIWLSYSPVATTVAEYYGRPVEAVNYFSLPFFVMTIPFSIVSTQVMNKFGLKVTIQVGAFFNCIGAVIKSFSTTEAIENLDVQYYVSLFGQCLAGIAQSFVTLVATKTSQTWFPENERALSTSWMCLSAQVGVILTFAVTPFIIVNPSDVPKANFIWAVVAVVGAILTALCIRRKKPKLPPSRSASKLPVNRPSIITQYKESLKNKSFLLIIMTVGTAQSIMGTSSTLTEQMLCTLGYSSAFSGLLVACLILVGITGAIVFSIIAIKTKKFEEIVKINIGITAIVATLQFEQYLIPNREIGIFLCAIITGFFGIGAYGISLELAVEMIYPAEESIALALVYCLSQCQATVFIIVLPMIATSQSRDNFLLSTCSGSTIYAVKDYTIPILVLIGLQNVWTILMILFVKVDYKRQREENSHNVK